jgi:hypothetical protein
MATTTPNFGWAVPTSTDLVKDGAVAIETLGDSIDASLVDLKGGTTGQVLAKASGTDMDFSWVAQDDSNAIQNAIVDAKGDLIAASANDTPARLAVGNNGETLVADSSTSTGLRYQGNYAAGKNKVINGDFGVWQRGTSFSNPSSSAYTADRWQVSHNGTGATRTISQQTFTPGTAPVAGYEGTFFYRYAMSVVGSGNTYQLIQQPVEDVRTFAGQTVTLSFWAKAGGSATIQTDFDQYFGSGGSSDVYSAQASHSVTTAWTRFSQTITLASISGKTIGTGSFLAFRILPAAATTITLDIWGVQLEAGSVATAFQTATGTIQGELAACQRYYVRWSGGNSYSHFGTGVTQSATNAYFTVVQPVEMRVAPTALDFSTMGFFNYVPNVFALSNLTLNSATTKVSQLYGTTSGATAQQFVTLCTNNSTAGFIGLSAEL